MSKQKHNCLQSTVAYNGTIHNGSKFVAIISLVCSSRSVGTVVERQSNIAEAQSSSLCKAVMNYFCDVNGYLFMISAVCVKEQSFSKDFYSSRPGYEAHDVTQWSKIFKAQFS